MSDEGKVWKFRPPPRTIGGQDAYKLCPVLVEEGQCRFGLQCADAHFLEEIQEWKERYSQVNFETFDKKSKVGL